MIPFTIKQIEIFYAVASQLSFTEAAKSLHLTQPAVSRQISNLEAQCDSALFEQIGKNIYLTGMGNLLFQHAKKIMEELDLLKVTVTEQSTVLKGTLNMGITNGLQHLIFDQIGNFYKKCPKVELKITVGNSNCIFPAFDKNEIDFCLMSNNATNKLNLSCERITGIPISLLMSSQNHLVNEKNINLQSLANETFLIGEEETTCYDCTVNLIKKLKTQPKVIQIKNFESIKYAVKANIGIAFLPPSIASLELKEKILIAPSIDDLPFYLYELYWVQHVNKTLSSVARIFKEFIFEKLSNTKEKFIGH